jgi:arylsulfatase A-like enzyme
MVSQLDRHVGEIGALLKEAGIDDNTIIIFTSDNGPERKGGILPSVFNSNGELRGIKRDLYEGGIRVPMIVKWPEKTEPGTISNYPWASWDFLPTVADILNVPAPEGIDGVSALPVFLGEEMDRPNELYWEFISWNDHVKMAVREGKWKGVVNGLQNEMELYDMEADPYESNNLSIQYPEKVDELKKLIKKTREPSVYWKIDEALLAQFYEK